MTACSGTERSVVRVATVGRATVSEVVDAPATVAARATATVTAPAAGTVGTLFVEDGQAVTGGTLLLRLDSPAARDRLRQAREADAQVRSSRVRLPAVDLSGFQAQVDASAAASFAASRAAAGAVPDPALRDEALARIDEAERQYQQARATAAAAAARVNAGGAGLSGALTSLTSAQRAQTRVAVDLAQQTVDALDVRAPISGVVQLGSGGAAAAKSGAGDLAGLLGQLPPSVQGQASGALGGTGAGGGGGSGGSTTSSTVAAGVPVDSGTPLATVFDVSSLTLTAEVDETDVFLVKPGVRARIELDAVPGATYDASVASVDLSPTTSSRGGVSYRVRLALSGGRTADGQVAPTPRPGMSAVADLEVRTAADAVAVPAAAIVRADARDAVWVVRGGVAHRQLVQLGAQGEDVVQVLDGVVPGDRIVVRGADTVREGQKLPR